MIRINNFLNQRLGNHLFMFAAGYALAKENNDKLYLEQSWKYVPYFENLDVELINSSTPSKDITFTEVYKETEGAPAFNYVKIPYKSNKLLIDGYFQSEKHFKYFEKDVRKALSFEPKFLYNLTEKHKVLIENPNTCAVHIRRTDYIQKSQYHPVMPLSYYLKAMKEMGKMTFIFFSDDIAWCKEVFTHPDFIFIEGQTDIEDLALMSMMKNQIIANSSFSWWGAWLNNNLNKKIIAPNIWFGPAYSYFCTDDIIPESWQKI